MASPGSEGCGFSTEGRRAFHLRTPVGFISASGVGKGVMIETGLLEKLSFSAESSSNVSFSGVGELGSWLPPIVLGLSASVEPKNENLLLDIGILKFVVILGDFLANDGTAWIIF